MTQGLSTDDLAGRSTEPEPQPPASDPGTARETAHLPLLDDDETAHFLDRWNEVQAHFVDDPQGAVSAGDGLVAELMQALARRFSDRKGVLEEQWNAGSQPETEELRLALQSYRSFFQRLLST